MPETGRSSGDQCSLLVRTIISSVLKVLLIQVAMTTLLSKLPNSHNYLYFFYCLFVSDTRERATGKNKGRYGLQLLLLLLSWWLLHRFRLFWAWCLHTLLSLNREILLRNVKILLEYIFMYNPASCFLLALLLLEHPPSSYSSSSFSVRIHNRLVGYNLHPGLLFTRYYY